MGKVLGVEDSIYVRRAQQGDCEAFNVLVQKYQNKVRRLIARWVKDDFEAEDLAQESFLKAYRALNQFRGDSAFYTWLYKIAVNTAKHHLTHPSRQKVVFWEEEENKEKGEDNHSPESVLMEKEIARTVQKALDSLSPELKEALEWRELEGLSYEEIAQKMHCPIGTVRSRIFRAREIIARYLKPLIPPSHKRW